LLVKREEGTARSFDDLATGLDTGAITRGRAMKLAGAAIVASALGLIGAGEAQGQDIVTERIRRRRCNRHGGDFCNNRGEEGFPFGHQCHICCGEGRGRRRRRRRRRRKACCGSAGCNCCRPGQRCRSNGLCD
jgi:hypothetical protein